MNPWNLYESIVAIDQDTVRVVAFRAALSELGCASGWTKCRPLEAPTTTDPQTDGPLAESWFRLIVEAAPNAMLIVDRQRHITLVNHGTEAMFGYDRDELIGRAVEVRLCFETYRHGQRLVGHHSKREQLGVRPWLLPEPRVELGPAEVIVRRAS